MKSHSISVTVGDSSVQVEPMTLVMTSDDEVRWTAAGGRPFSVVFDDIGPFGNRELPHAVATSHQKPRNKGRFKYTVVSQENPSVRLDPVIVVDDPPSMP